MSKIKYRFWDDGKMIYGDTDDIDFVKKSIGKEKMLCIGEYFGKSFYVKDICKVHNTRPSESTYQYYGVINETAFGYYHVIINRRNLYDQIHGINVNDEIVGNIYEHSELLKKLEGE